MPTYDYLCEACEHEFEEFQSITAAPLKKCPQCGKRSLKRLIGTGGGVIFKGSGFYQTDYRSDSYRKAAKADSQPSGSSSDAKSADKKSAEKSTAGDSKKKSKSSTGSKVA